ncbi:signal peptidase I, partial [Candidatus Woesearchaeota archaeon]|nr:signal peptidase I [Candidatus Woesearchaeota archaeon]
RVIEKGVDDDGVYYLVKGDNNRFADPLKVRYADVVGVVVAVIY